jgi:hypothetical protein
MQKPAEDQPSPPMDLTPAQKALIAKRDNAFRELAQITAQLSNPNLAIFQLELGPGRTAVIHANPGALSELVQAVVQQSKQMQIAIDCLVNMLFEEPKPPCTLEEFIRRSTFTAEQTVSTMRRAVLSQGGRAPVPGIIKPS